jgi:DNA-binding MarR family transcriptional regulator
MEQQGLVERRRSKEDERKVLVYLTEKGKQLQEQAARIPEQLVGQLLKGDLKTDDLIRLKEQLTNIIDFLSK